MLNFTKALKRFLIDQFVFGFQMGGGGGGGSGMTNTTQNVTTTTIPEYAQPYAQAMLGGAMKQVFQMTPNGRITGTTPYMPYGVDQGVFTDPALTNPILQWNAGQQQRHPAEFAAAQQAQQAAMQRQQNAVQQAYMPYKQGDTYSTTGPSSAQGSAAVAGFSPMQMQAFQAAQNLQVPGQFAEGSDLVRQAGQGSLGIAGQAQQLGGTALGYGAKAADIGMKGIEYGDIASRIGQEGYQRAVQDATQAAGISDIYGGQGAGYGAAAAAQAGQGYGAQAAYQQQATSPSAIQAYMNPYLQASLDPQLKLLAQQTGIQGAAQQAAATSSGAFGGSRSALQNALTQQAGNMAAQQAIGQGYNQAFQQAQQAQQYGAGLGIQGLQAGTQAQLAGVQGAQAGLQGVGQRINAGQLGLAGAGTGIQGQLAGIQGVQAALQGQGLGIQGTQAATQAGQLGLAGYGQAGSQGVNLANIGNLQLGAQQGIIGMQGQMGGMQQQQAQNVINAAMGEYNTAQQYPYQQYAFMNSLLRGLPMSGSSTQQNYVASPNAGSQIGGMVAGIAGPALYRAMG
jgi:hypothetical protein